MPKTVKTRSGRVLVLPTLAEDAAIAAGIAQDPDAYEPSDIELGVMRRPGRPVGSGTKTQVTLRLDSDLLQSFKATGAGWQTRINDALRDWRRTHENSNSHA